MVKNISFSLFLYFVKEKIKEILIREFQKWIKKVLKKIKKNPKQTIPVIFVSPFLIHAFAEVLVDFSLFTAIGYYVACIYGYYKILDDPYRVIKWGVGYAICASVTPLIFSSIWPQIKEGTYVSVFSALVIVYVLFMVWWRARELKNT